MASAMAMNMKLGASSITGSPLPRLSTTSLNQKAFVSCPRISTKANGSKAAVGIPPLKRFACRASAGDKQSEVKTAPQEPGLENGLNYLGSFGSKVLSALQKPAAVAMLLASLLVGEPDMALAAGGGGRVGGRVSRDSYSAPSYSSPSSSYSYSVPAPSYSVPYYAPSPFFGGLFAPTVYIGGGGGIFGLLFFGLFVMVAINAVTGFLRGSDEDDVYTTDVTVVRVQVGLLGLARTLQRDLERIANQADTSSAEGLQYILSETALSLLRHPDYCVYGRSTVEIKRSDESGESAFNALSLEERGKFAEETLVNVGNIRRRISRAPKAERFNSEYIVVTILVAAEGKFDIPQIRNSGDLKAALSKLGSIPSDNIQAVEVLWTPQDDEDTLSERELLQDYPQLTAL